MRTIMLRARDETIQRPHYEPQSTPPDQLTAWVAGTKLSDLTPPSVESGNKAQLVDQPAEMNDKTRGLRKEI